MEINQNAADQQATEGAGNSGSQEGLHQGTDESKGQKLGLWINQLPRSLRSSFNGEDMPTVGDLAREYLRLRELGKSTEGQTEEKPARKHAEESYAEVSKFFSDGNDFNSRVDQKLFSLLKESDVDPAKLSEIFSMRPSEDDMKSAAKKATEARDANLRKMWGDAYDANGKWYRRALDALDGDTMKEITRSGDIYSPFVADLLVKYAKATDHGAEADSATGSPDKGGSWKEIMGWKD